MTASVTSSGEITDWVVKKWMAVFTPAWFALHTADPVRAGATQSEVVGGSYKRMSGAWTDYDARTIWLATKLLWDGLPEVTLTHVAVWDHGVNGHLLSCAQLPSPFPHVAQGGSFQLSPHTYAISVAYPS